MKNLWDDLNNIEKLLNKHKHKIIICDFDGTLAPIVSSPKEAKLSTKTRNLLQKLSLKQETYLAIISGRKLSDIKEKIMLPNIIYGGNHGLEGEIFGEKYSFPIPSKTLWILNKILRQLNQALNQFKGIFIENKGLSLGIHYRLADKQKVLEIKSLLNKILKPVIKKEVVSTVKGKEVIDIIPNVNWDKGCFAQLLVKKITDRTKELPAVIVAGDDNTDESAFEKLKEEITIVVGNNSKSKACYYIRNTAEADSFLEWLCTKVQ